MEIKREPISNPEDFRARQMLARLVERIGFHERRAQVEAGLGVIGAQRQGVPVTGDRLLRTADRARDVAVGQVAHEAQRHRRALARGQPSYRLPQRLIARDRQNPSMRRCT